MAGRGDRSLLLILGSSYDPRVLNAAAVLSSSGIIVSSIRLIEFDIGRESPTSTQSATTNNISKNLSQLFPDVTIDTIPVSMRNTEGLIIGGRRISEAFRNRSLFENITDIVVDVTAIPKGLYFPLLRTIHALSTNTEEFPNVHVLVCDDPNVDNKIVGEGGDRAEMIHGFGAGTQLTSEFDPVAIWAPVLGEDENAQLRKIYGSRQWRAVCPILPFPARNPRRGDDLMLEYRQLINDEWAVEPNDISYADEQNPFDVYSTLCRIADGYRSSLKMLGTPQIVTSSHSSKLLSLGVLLAAIDRDLGVIHVEPTGYIAQNEINEADGTGELFEIWLSGEPYGL